MFAMYCCDRAVRHPRKIRPPLKTNFPTKNKIPEEKFANKGRTRLLLLQKLWKLSYGRSLSRGRNMLVLGRQDSKNRPRDAIARVEWYSTRTSGHPSLLLPPPLGFKGSISRGLREERSITRGRFCYSVHKHCRAVQSITKTTFDSSIKVYENSNEIVVFNKQRCQFENTSITTIHSISKQQSTNNTTSLTVERQIRSPI